MDTEETNGEDTNLVVRTSSGYLIEIDMTREKPKSFKVKYIILSFEMTN